MTSGQHISNVKSEGTEGLSPIFVLLCNKKVEGFQPACNRGKIRFNDEIVEQHLNYKQDAERISVGKQQQQTMKHYLPEYKVFSDDSLDSIITPNVPV